MKYLCLTCLFIVTISLSAQDQENIRIYRSAVQQGEQFLFGGKSIKFKEVITDSRCPIDVTCIWAGEAKVLIEMFENGRFIQEKIIAINSTDIPLDFSAEDVFYTLATVELMPYPTTKSTSSKPDYRLQIQLRERK